MPVKKDASGRRSVEAEVEVPGTPEVVWQAIATGPGISSWFVPTTVEEREGGSIVCNFGPGMESLSTITTWEPPQRFAARCRLLAASSHRSRISQSTFRIPPSGGPMDTARNRFTRSISWPE